MRVAVVIPAFQAAASIGDVVARTQAAVPAAEIIVVDDGSDDGTGEEGRRRGATLVTHPRNRGKGVSLRAGVARACAHDASVIVTIDADGQHPPEEIPGLLRPIAEGDADLVLGARKRDGGMPLSRRFTNWLSATLASRIGGQQVRDAQTGFRAFTRDVAEGVQAAGDRYEYEANFLLDALRAGFRVVSVDVPTIYGARSHFHAWGDTWRMARAFGRHARRIVR
ncbi:MAG: glycosyltransferase family 2 protein [Gemmatimonadetes bacterium]|nr:MAG: glycosyltransferase family 2 protein [Gemmatimonadota bacterium]